jgi:hypothetical protein
MKIKNVLYISLFLLLIFYSCKKFPFLAGDEAIIEISSQKNQIKLDESTRIFVVGYNADDSLLWDGTIVDFIIENGTLSENRVELKDGRGEVTAFGNISRGEMKISARSGGITAEPDPLIVMVGEVIEVFQIVVSLNPSVLPVGGGRVEIRVKVYDEYIQPISSTAVVLETDCGTLDSRSSPLVTNENGEVIDFLETDSEANITIMAGDKTKEITVKVEEEAANELPTASFIYSPLIPGSGETVYFNASGSYDPDGVITSYKWDFGDGTFGNGEKPRHVFYNNNVDDKTFVVTLTVYDDKGARNSTSNPVTIKSQGG